MSNTQPHWANDLPEVPPELGPVRLHEQIGMGGMARVYRGTHLHLRRQVAVKVIYGDLAGPDPFKEAHTVASLMHEHIVAVFHADRDGPWTYIVMELLEGGTLRRHLQEGKVDLPTALSWVEQAASALATAHAGGIIHCDVKPDNLLLTRDGRVKVCDFGIAMHLASAGDGSPSNGRAGSLPYMAPELFVGGIPSAASDVYALGFTLFELLTGSPPFGRDGSLAAFTAAHLHAPFPVEKLKSHNVPSHIADLVVRMCARSAPDRCPAMELVSSALLAHTRNGHPLAPGSEIQSGSPGGIVPPLEGSLAKRPGPRRDHWAYLTFAMLTSTLVVVHNMSSCSIEAPSQVESPPRTPSVGLPNTMPLTVVWIEAGSQLPGVADPTQAPGGLRRYLGDSLLPALVALSPRAIVLDVAIHPDAGGSDLEAFRQVLIRARGAGIAVAAPWPAGASSPLIDECPDPSRGCFDRLLSTWVGPNPISEVVTCGGVAPSLAEALVWMLLAKEEGESFRTLARKVLTEGACHMRRIPLRLPQVDRDPWTSLSSREVLDAPITSRHAVAGAVVLVGMVVVEDFHQVKDAVTAETRQVDGLRLHALMALNILAEQTALLESR